MRFLLARAIVFSDYVGYQLRLPTVSVCELALPKSTVFLRVSTYLYFGE